MSTSFIEIEQRYREQVVEHYNRLSLTGLPERDPGLQWIRRVKEQAQKKSVLLVEGNTDVRILGYFLNQVLPSWDAKLVMRSASRKSQVIEGIKHCPEWVGIVDKDEWAPTQIASQLQNVPRVKTLPRFCTQRA